MVKLKNSSYKIHSSDLCSICSNDSHHVVKNRERKNNKVKTWEILDKNTRMRSGVN
jgi:hypothetical protein